MHQLAGCRRQERARRASTLGAGLPSVPTQDRYRSLRPSFRVPHLKGHRVDRFGPGIRILANSCVPLVQVSAVHKPTCTGANGSVRAMDARWPQVRGARTVSQLGPVLTFSTWEISSRTLPTESRMQMPWACGTHSRRHHRRVSSRLLVGGGDRSRI